MTKQAQRLLEMLPDTPGAAADKETLCGSLGVPERTVRRIVADLRASGHPVLSNSSGRGYYLPSPDPAVGVDQCKTYIREASHRARATFVSIRGARNYINRHHPQLTLEDLLGAEKEGAWNAE